MTSDGIPWTQQVDTHAMPMAEAEGNPFANRLAIAHHRSHQVRWRLMTPTTALDRTCDRL